MKIFLEYRGKIASLSLDRILSRILLIVVAFLLIEIANAATPDPGHAWAGVGDGTFAVANTLTAARTFTFPDANATVLTSSAAVTLAQGGTNASLTASTGGIVYSAASAFAVLSGTATAGQMLRSGASAAPTWSTATYPATAGTSGNVLTSDGTNWVSSAPSGGADPDQMVFATPVGLNPANLTAVTAFATNNSYFVFMGAAPKAYTSCDVRVRVTTAAATITWAEVGIFEGNPPTFGGAASLTRKGFTNVAATFNSTGQKTTTVAVSGVAVGNRLWVALGSQATTPFQVRGMLADDLQSGVFQTDASRPSTAASPEATVLGGATAVPPWVAMRCT